MHGLILFLSLSMSPSCDGVLADVCAALAAGRYTEAAEVAAPIAADPDHDARVRQSAVSIAVGAWVRDGSPAARCKAKGLLAAYLQDPALPRPPAMLERQAELANEPCELLPIVRARVAAPPSVRAEEPKPEPRPVVQPLPRRRERAGQRAVGASLLSVGAGLVGLSLGAAGVMAREMVGARRLVSEATAAERQLSAAEVGQFKSHFLAARTARDVALGVGVSGAVAVTVGLACLLAGRRSPPRWGASSTGIVVKF